MARAKGSADISILPPGYSDDVGLTLLQNEDGSVAFARRTESILPSASPPGAPSTESFDPQVRVEYVMETYHRGVGDDRHHEGRGRAGLVKNVDTRYANQAFSGPKIRYISDINYLDNGDMEDFTGGVPTGWTNVSAATIAEENTIVNSGTSSVKVTSAGAGDLCRYTLVHGEFLQCELRLTGSFYVPTGSSAAIARINNSIGDVDATSTTNDAWETFDISLSVGTTALSLLTIDLIPAASSSVAYFDDVKLEIRWLTGPPGPFVEIDISAVSTLFHFSGRTTWKLDTADTDDNGLPRWIATELASHNITDVRLMNDRMWRAEGASGLWTHSTDGVTWTDNTLSGDDRFADQLAVTQTMFGYDALWKAVKPNKLGVSTTPSTGGWAYYTIGNSDTDILDIIVEDNLLYIVKEDGVFMIGPNGIPTNITSSWSHMRQTARSAGGSGWMSHAYIPAGRHGLWEFGPQLRRSAHPGDQTPAYDEYNGPVTKAIGDDSWLYQYLQKRTDSSPTLTNIMAGRPVSQSEWRFGQIAEIDAGMVRHGWITGTQFAGTRMFWSSQETEATVTQANAEGSPSTLANTDNSGKREWSNVANVGASDDTYATWPDEGTLSSGPDSSGTIANNDISNQEPWDNPSNAAASDDSRATSDLDEIAGSLTSPTTHNSASGWTGTLGNLFASDNVDAVSDVIAFGSATNYVEVGTFGLSIPSAAIITNVTITHEGTRHGAGGQVWGGIIVGGSRQSESFLASTLNADASGDAVNSNKKTPANWGYSGLIGSEVNAANFGVFFRVKNTGTSGTAWYDIDHIQVQVDYTFAKTDGLNLTNFGITLPADADIKGIEVSVERSVDTGSDVVDDLVQLVVGGTLSGDNNADVATAWPTTEAAATYGGATDLWGLTPTRAQVIASDFGVEIRATKGTSATTIQARIDHVTIAIHYATNETSDYIDAQNFGFSIPTSATIDGIIVEIERKSTNSKAKDATLQLLNASGTPAGDDKAALLTAWGTTDTVASYGGASDTWAISPTVAMVNDADFGVRLSITSDIDETASIDHISITIYYTAASGSELDNRLGWLSVPDTENPRYDPAYEFESGGTLRTGRINRFPGWKTNWQEVTIKSSPKSGETLGSNGRQITVKYDNFDGTGFNELGGSGNGVFSTSPAQTKYFKTATVASVISEDMELELSFEHTENDETPVVTQVALSGTVRPKIVERIQFSVLVGDDMGLETTRGADKLAAIRAMLDPDLWASTLYDRDGTAHIVIPDVNGYAEQDALHYADPDGKPRVVKIVQMQCFIVPNSTNWSS